MPPFTYSVLMVLLLSAVIRLPLFWVQDVIKEYFISEYYRDPSLAHLDENVLDERANKLSIRYVHVIWIIATLLIGGAVIESWI